MNKLLYILPKLSIYAVVFLVPLIWAPWIFEAFEFNKQYALFILVFIGITAWFVKMVLKDRELRFTRTPLDIPVLAFQLGLVYYRQDRLTDARKELERAKQISPNNSNTKYILGLVYDRQGRSSDALSEFQGVLTSNPRNEEVQNIVENLKAGRLALEGIVSSTPPVQEGSPPELERGVGNSLTGFSNSCRIQFSLLYSNFRYFNLVLLTK